MTTTPEAARLADTLRAAAKRQGLSGSDLADRIERLTGSRPGPMTVSRWMNGQRLVRFNPAIVPLANALGLDPVRLIAGAAMSLLPEPSVPPTGSPESGTLPLQSLVVAPGQLVYVSSLNLMMLAEQDNSTPVMIRVERDRTWTASGSVTVVADPVRGESSWQCAHPTSTEPDRPGQGCSKCCDTCNLDGHRCEGCGTPVGHLTRRCPDCPDPDEMNDAPVRATLTVVFDAASVELRQEGALIGRFPVGRGDGDGPTPGAVAVLDRNGWRVMSEWRQNAGGISGGVWTATVESGES